MRAHIPGSGQVVVGLLGDAFPSESGISFDSNPVLPRSVSWLGLKCGFHELLLAAVDRQIVNFSNRVSPLSVHGILVFFISGIDGRKAIGRFRVYK